MLDGSATLPLGAAAGTRKCRVPVSCLLAGLVLEGEGRCEGGQPSALPSLTLPTGGWRGGAGRGGRGKASTASAKHHKGAHFLAAAEGQAAASIVLYVPLRPFSLGSECPAQPQGRQVTAERRSMKTLHDVRRRGGFSFQIILPEEIMASTCGSGQ
ncbi:hypothetical protein E2C01_016027 [Portunus trituberculatus]|uniref:Uncharacterized protein n=1 Tax=Portunus trituberculatus TaxID=210409 RepID=A0A5B7DPN3_PORTR|nr:hypothetical protein [Portunus trituberculatus]